jgi:predicted amidophosphoribosyltransferase
MTDLPITLAQMKEANKEICQNCGIRIEKGTGWCSECLKGLDNDGQHLCEDCMEIDGVKPE